MLSQANAHPQIVIHLCLTAGLTVAQIDAPDILNAVIEMSYARTEANYKANGFPESLTPAGL